MTRLTNTPVKKATRIVGLSYILVILLGIIKVNFIEPTVIITGDANLGSNILANSSLFRIGIACEIIMYLLVVVLSLGLFIILRPVARDLALSALVFRFGEAIIGLISIILSGLIPLLLLNSEPAFDEIQMQMLLSTFLNVRTAGLNIVLIFIGVGGTIFCYLFYRSLFIPRILAAWGIFTYASMFVIGFLNILFPNLPDMIETVLFGLGALFEVTFGFWLLLRGVNIEKWKDHAAEVAE